MLNIGPPSSSGLTWVHVKVAGTARGPEAVMLRGNRGSFIRGAQRRRRSRRVRRNLACLPDRERCIVPFRLSNAPLPLGDSAACHRPRAQVGRGGARIPIAAHLERSASRQKLPDVCVIPLRGQGVTGVCAQRLDTRRGPADGGPGRGRVLSCRETPTLQQQLWETVQGL